MKTKICTKCNTPKELKFFSKRKNSKERNILIREENRQNIFNFLKNKECVDCGESNILVLEFDHKDPSLKLFNVTDSLDSSWKTILKEIDKCEIRCCNCHKIKTHKQFNTYRFIYSKNL